MQANHLPVARSDTTALTVSEEIRQRFDEFSRSQKDVGQYIVDHLEEAAFPRPRSWPGARTPRRRPWSASRRRSASRASPSFRPPPATSRRAREVNGGGEPSAPPLFPIDQTEFEAALAADHANVEETHGG